MDAGGHFGCPKITFDRISGHFRSILNLDGTTISIIELVRDIWMSNAYVKFEERSLKPSKFIGGCVAGENIIFPETCVSREYNNYLGFAFDIIFL